MADPETSLESAAEDPASALLRRWQQSADPEALDDLLRLEIGALKARVKHAGRGLLHSSVSASDVVNQAVFKALRSEALPNVPDLRAFEAYLWRCAERLLLDRLRAKQKPSGRPTDAGSGVLERAVAGSSGLSDVDRADETRRVAFAINLLPDEMRHVLELRYVRALEPEEGARELGISVDAFRRRVVRAKHALAQKLAAWRSLLKPE